jgi:hypothetical protein
VQANPQLNSKFEVAIQGDQRIRRKRSNFVDQYPGGGSER